MTTLGSQSNILKEVYKKGRVKKLATDGQNDFNGPGDGVHTRKTGNVPPFMKNRKVANAEDAKKAKGDAARRRLAMMRKNSGGK